MSPQTRPHAPWTTLGLAALHAVLFAAAFPPVGAWPLVLVAPAPLAWAALRARSTRVAVLVVLPVQWLMWLWMLRWLINVTAVGYPLLAFYLSLYAVALVWLLRLLDGWPRTASWPVALRLPVAWVGLECARGALVFDGYPWFLLAHPLVEWTPLVQSADLLGSYFSSFLAAATAGAIVDLAGARGASPRRAGVAVGALALLHALNLGYGLWRRGAPPSERTLRVAVVQTNLPQDNKIGWPRARWKADVDVALQLSRDAVASAGPVDLIIWPETMLPGLGLEPATMGLMQRLAIDPDRELAVAAIRLSEEIGTPLLIGSIACLDVELVRDPDPRLAWSRQHNSAYLVDGPPPYQRYDKVFLTPFGEVMPYISAWPWLEQKLLSLGAPGMSFSLDAGEEPVRLRLGGEGERPVVLGTPICFEDTVPAVCRRMVHEGGAKVVDLLVNMSNDGWFGGFDGGRARHNQIARFRCIESRVPMVRSVNTGQSAAFDSAGNVISVLGSGRYGEARRAGILVAELPLDGRRTIYGRLGDVWAWGCLLVSATLAAAAVARRRRARAATSQSGDSGHTT